MNANASRAWLSHTFFEIAVYILLTILQLDFAFTSWFTTSVVLVARRDPAVWSSRSKTYDWEAAYGKPPSLLDENGDGRRRGAGSPLEVVLGPPSEKGKYDGEYAWWTPVYHRPEAKRSKTWNDYFPTRWTGPRPRLESTPHLPIQNLPPPTPFDAIPPVPALPTEPVPALTKQHMHSSSKGSIGNGSEMRVNVTSTPIMEHDQEHEHERESERERYFEQDLQRQMQQSPVAHSASSHQSHHSRDRTPRRELNRTPTRDRTPTHDRANPLPVKELDMNQMPVSPLDPHLNAQPKGVPEDISLSGTPYSGFRPLSIVQSLWSHRRSQTYPQAGQEHGYGQFFHHHRPPPPVPPIPEQYRQQAQQSTSQAPVVNGQKDGRKGILSIKPLKLGRGRVSVDKTMIGMPKAITLTVNGPAIDGGSPEQSFANPSSPMLPISVRSHSRGMSLDSGINNNHHGGGGASAVVTSPHTSYSASKYSSGLKSIGLGANGRFSVDEMGRLPSLPPRSPLGGVLEEERSATPSVQGSRKADEINIRPPPGASSAKGSSNRHDPKDTKGRGAEFDPNYLFPVANTISSVASRSSRYSTGGMTIPPTPPPKDNWPTADELLPCQHAPHRFVETPHQQSPLSREPSQSHSSSSKQTQKQSQQPQQQRSTPPLVRSYSARTQQTYGDSSGGEQRRVRSPTGYI
ncbi:2569_t:CDS:2 [Acaulospora colombiana]|uniref:2569_t:CDS:1 n=1 Tax=Acaulospora colombiana TaxID=27376 RepID=A0ACA9L9F2_9GLOM|nr:2569_t:CDS:2 [Acaulospora colombiana]